MNKLKRIIIAATVVICCCIALCIIIGRSLPSNIESKAQELQSYCKKHGYNTEIGVLVDYGRYSGRVRFFVWDFKQEKVILRSTCAQGCGKGANAGKKVFSNEIGSLCTSLGHYKIGKQRKMNSMKGRPAFTLTGLDKTNSNAIVRGILLHPVHLPSYLIYPLSIPEKVWRVLGKALFRPYSEGCITIPFKQYHKTADILLNEKKPVIMWVYK